MGSHKESLNHWEMARVSETHMGHGFAIWQRRLWISHGPRIPHGSCFSHGSSDKIVMNSDIPFKLSLFVTITVYNRWTLINRYFQKKKKEKRGKALEISGRSSTSAPPFQFCSRLGVA